MTMLFPVFVSLAIFHQASGHGRLMDPPSRSSAWRLGFPTPRNYDDNILSCGGLSTRELAGGKCGVCGDPWNDRQNEAGGKYATGLIVRNYTMGQTINLEVAITSNLGGWMEFRICPNNDVTKPVTRDCLNTHVLQKADGSGTKTLVNGIRTGSWSMDYKLPDGMTCSQCVIQWKYHTGNHWGVDQKTGKACIGCGQQDEYYGCADVSIDDSGVVPEVQTPVQEPEDLSDTKVPCKGIHNWANDPDMDRWCTDNCAVGNCPVYGCDCSSAPPAITSTTTTTTTQRPTTASTTTTPKPVTTIAPTAKITQPSSQLMNRTECKATNLWAGNQYLDRWCADSCARGNCPTESCKCTVVQKMVTQSTTTILLPETSMTTRPAGHTQKVCIAISLWKGIKVFDNWCTEECNKGNCPDDTCQCTEQQTITTTTTTKIPDVTSLGKCTSNGIVGGDYWNVWCQNNCNKGLCDDGYCFCNV